MNNDLPSISVNGEPPKPLKKPRALPRVWTRYWNLHEGREFFLGSIHCTAVGPFIAFEPKRGRFFIWPLKRVRTTVLVRDAKPGGKSSHEAVVGALEAARQRVDEVESQVRARIEQPNSDNQIGGPTS